LLSLILLQILLVAYDFAAKRELIVMPSLGQITG
jgi:hypothetical protein